MEETQAASTPALEAVRTEVRDIATNPQNPRHSGYTRNDSQVSAYIDGLYRKAVGTGVVEIGNPVFKTDPGKAAPQTEQDAPLSREDRVAQTEVETMLQRTLGNDYEPEMRYMGVGASHLFSIPDGKQVLDAFAPLIADLGPEAEVASVRFMAHLGRLLTARKGA